MGTCHCLHISFSLLIWQIVKQSETRMHRTLIVRRASCLGSNGHEQAWLWAFNVHFSKQIRKDLRCCWICKENENVMKLLLFEVWRWQRKALFEWNFFPHKRKLDVCVRAQLAPLSATNRIQTKSWKQPQLSNLNLIWSDNYNCTISMFPVLLQQPKTLAIVLESSVKDRLQSMTCWSNGQSSGADTGGGLRQRIFDFVTNTVVLIVPIWKCKVYTVNPKRLL